MNEPLRKEEKPPPSAELRILMLEDQPEAAELAERALRKGGICFTAQRVDTREAFLRALDEFQPDIVLLDYRLPGFDGGSALALLRERCPQIPAIMVTGSLGDERTIELVKAGARDYVLKDNLLRLPGAVTQALSQEQSIRERKAAEAHMRESEMRYRQLFESSSDAIMTLSQVDRRFMHANPAALVLFGVESLERLRWFTPVNLSPERQPDGEPSCAKAERMMAVAMEKGAHRFEWLHRSLDGRLFPAEVSLVCMQSDGDAWIQATVRDISERKAVEEARLNQERMRRRSMEQTVSAFAAAGELRDPYTAGHQSRVADLAEAIARQLNLDAELVHGLRLAAVIHDLGKIQIPSGILSKPGKLTSIEYQLIQTHAQAGYEILKDIEFPWPIADIVWQHHERMDGSGYPQGLKAGEILPEARILAVADVVEAISSHRPYRSARGIEVALQQIDRERETGLDADAVDACLALFREQGYQMPVWQTD